MAQSVRELRDLYTGPSLTKNRLVCVSLSNFGSVFQLIQTDKDPEELGINKETSHRRRRLFADVRHLSTLANTHLWGI